MVSAPNKKIHTITYTRPTLENGKYMMNCWTFDRRDPIGKYVLTVKIGKHEFEKQVFHVIEELKIHKETTALIYAMF